MKIREIFKWMTQCETKFGKRPSVIPISKPEMIEITSDHFTDVNSSGNGEAKIFGVDTEMSPWAEMTRHKILEIGVERLCMEQRIDEKQLRIERWKDIDRGQLVQRLTAYILTDVTHLDVSFDWDRLSWLKRRVKWVGRRWPVKRKTVRIEGKVLYPYLKIRAPADTHKVRFALAR